jgi:hypothetical protein
MREKEKEENEGKIWRRMREKEKEENEGKRRKMSKRFGRGEGRVLGERKIKFENGKRKGEYGEEDETGQFLGCVKNAKVHYIHFSELSNLALQGYRPPSHSPHASPFPFVNPTTNMASLSKYSKHKGDFQGHNSYEML